MNDASLGDVLAAAGLPGVPRSRRPLGGGCIHRVEAVELEDGRIVVVKSGDAAAATIFAEEAMGLETLARTGTVLAPTVLHHGAHGGTAGLVLSHVTPAAPSDEGWIAFGHDLAMLHRADPAAALPDDRDRGYGFVVDNHLGATPQPNAWHDDWVVFNRDMRLGHQVRLARDAGRLEDGAFRRLSRLLERLDTVLPRRPHPSLLHGDLWAGNALPTRDPAGRARVAVIDPAPSIGDGWADVAMMQLFGGFPPICIATYTDAMGGAPDDVEGRLAVYRLYHLLNHLNLFGSGYAGQVMGEVLRLEA